MQVIYNSEAAKMALDKALSTNQEMVDEFKKTFDSIQSEYARSGEVVSGRMGETVGNSFANTTGEQFTKMVQEKTKEFLEDTVPAIMKEYDQMVDKTTLTYSKATVDVETNQQ